MMNAEPDGHLGFLRPYFWFVRGRGHLLANLGLAYQKLNQPEKACELWRQALRIYEEIKSPTAEMVRGWLEESCQNH
jgi:tetratricopeptide (TPR) repeat protein